MKRRLIILIAFFLVFCIVIAGQSAADRTYDLTGEWNAIYSHPYGNHRDIIKITQQGNKFVGIQLIGSVHVPKGEETIKGELIGEMIKHVSLRNYKEGEGGGLVWGDSQGVIIEGGNKIVIQTYSNNYFVLTLMMTRKP